MLKTVYKNIVAVFLHWGFSLGASWSNCTRISVLIVQNRCGTVCELLNTCLVSLQKLLLVTCWYGDDRWKMELWFQEYTSHLFKEKLCLLLSPKRLLIVDWADFFAEAKFWQIKFVWVNLDVLEQNLTQRSIVELPTCCLFHENFKVSCMSL